MPWFVGCGSVVRASDLVGEVTQCFCGSDLVGLVGFMGLIWWVLVVSGFWLFCLDGSWFFFVLVVFLSGDGLLGCSIDLGGAVIGCVVG